ncbi:MAG: SRPBCC family protein [Panacagrimonas sp.]
MAYTIEVRRIVPLPVEKTFALLADHNRLGTVLGLPVKRTRDGKGDVNGVGSVRTLGIWPLDFDETVTVFEPGTRIDYRITRGSPLRKHLGSVRFEPSGSGTQVTWNIEYEMGVPVLGTAIKHGLGFGISRGLGKLGR